MSVFRYYLRFPTSPTTYSDEFEITERVIEGGSSTLKQTLTNNEYDVGTIKFNKITLELVNSDSFFSEAANQFSIFTFKRDESILRIEWDVNPEGLSNGSVPCGYSFLSKPVDVYEGLLEDNSSAYNERTQVQTFTFLGLESIIQKAQTPFSALSVFDDVETTVFNILNQAKITRILNVDQSNISVNTNFTPDSIDSLENTSCLEALDEILFLAGAVLYVKDGDVIVTPRTIGATVAATFYGRASDKGIENILDISKFTTGLNRTFNFWSWNGTSITQSFPDSVEDFGFRPKEVDSDLITDSGKQTTILSALLSEFGFPKQELEIDVPMFTPFVKDVFLLDKINLDIPVEFTLPEDGSLPARYGQAIYGDARYIVATSSFVVSDAENWKVLNRSVSIRNKTLQFRIRRE